MKLKFSGLGLALFACLMAGSPDACADSVVLSPAADTYIASDDPGTNGFSSVMVIGSKNFGGGGARSRALVRFDLAGQIPAGATITSVTLSLKVVKAPSQTNSTFALHRMLQEWNETDTTWTQRVGPGVAWGEPGGAAVLDYVAASSATKVIPTNDAVYVFDSNPALVADVAAWLTGAAPNRGWMIRVTDESILASARKVAAKENFFDVPQLVVQFTAPPPPLRITSVGVLNNELCLTFPARAGKRYVVDHRPDLDSGAWTVLTNISIRTVNMEVIVCEPLGVENQFYRVSEF